MAMTEMLRLVITADADQAVKKIKQLGGVSDSAAKSTDDLGKSSKQTGVLMKAGLVAGATAAAYAMVRFGASSVKAAAEAEQAQMRLDDAFAKFPKLADSSADALRQLNTEMQKKTRFDDDALASGQAILAQFDLTGRQIEDLTPLVADYAAKMGLDIPTASTNVGKALLGNMKALKSLGIDYKLTGDKAVDFANITELMGAKVSGFAEKDGKTAAGQLAILNNQFGELQETVGKQLLPALSGIVTGMTAVVGTFGALPGPVQATALAITGVSVAALVAIPRIAALKVAMVELGWSAGGVVKGLGKAGVLAGLIAVGVAVQKTASETMALVESLDATARTGETFAERMERLRDASASAGETLDVYASGIDNLGDLLGTAGQGAGDLWASIMQGENAIDKLREAQAAANAEMLKYGQAVREVADANGYSDASLVALLETMDTEGKTYLEIKAELADLAAAKANATVASDGLSESTQTLADDLADATDKANAYRKAIDLMGGGVLGVNDAQADFNATIAEGTAKLKENGATIDLNTEAGRSNFDALKSMRDAAVDLAGAVYEQTGSLNQANGVLDVNRARMYEAGAQAGLTAGQVDALVGTINSIPPRASTTVTANTSQASQSIDALRAKWDAFKRAFSGSPAAQLPSGANVTVPARAAGGPVTAGTPYLVGEKGPELFVPGTSGGIVPNGALSTSRATGTAGSTTVVVNVGGSVVSERDLVRAVRDGLVDMQRRGDTVAA